MLPEPQNANDYNLALEKMNNSIVSIREILDLELPKELGLDTRSDDDCTTLYGESRRRHRDHAI